MAQRRLISRALGCSEKFTAVPGIAGKLGEFAQLLYCLMIPHLDDYGRMADGPKGIKLSVLPDSPRPVEDFEHALAALHDAGLIVRYESRGDRVIQLTRFKEEQPGLRLDRSKAPRWDDPPENTSKDANTGNIPAMPGKSSLSELNLSELNRTEDVRTAPSALDARFDAFWKAYPRKVGKGAALKAWRRIKPSDTLTDLMLAAVEQQVRSDQWRKDGGRYIPNPATWLNQERWQDEPEDCGGNGYRRPGKDYEPVGAPTDCQHEPRCESYWEHSKRLHDGSGP